MDAILIAVAFLGGLLVQQIGLPPLVGYLVAGFALSAFGLEGDTTLETLADLGVKLMLFAIGIKLQVRSLLKTAVWGTGLVHAAISVVGFTLLFLGMHQLGWGPFSEMELYQAILLGFALSFSSTVFAVKTLGDNASMGAMHARIAIGILIMQDVLAVIFLTASTGKLPSIWAIPLIVALILAKPIIGWLIGRSGHGELIALAGLFLALVLGAKGFEAVGLKPDLGALFIGVLAGQHPKSKEISKSLLNLTDLLLVGFFLDIGLEGFPSFTGFVTAIGLTAVVAFKVALFFLLLTRFRLRARSSWVAGLSLGSYSEFGLIILSLSVGKDWIGQEWLVILAISLGLSFIVAAPFNHHAAAIYDFFKPFLLKFERSGRHPDDVQIKLETERVAIFGMGRVGSASYRFLSDRFPEKVAGFDRDPVKVQSHREHGRRVYLADANDSDFWDRMIPTHQIELVVLSMPQHSANLEAAKTLHRLGYDGVITATAMFDDEVRELREAGVDTAFNLYNEAGSGFAQHIAFVFHHQRPDLYGLWRTRDPEE